MSSAPPLPPPAGEAAAAGAAAAPDASWDLYALLSLPSPAAPLGPSSSSKDLQTAYRKKAKQLHPDKNPDPKAAVLFAQLQLIYDFLSDSANRSAYDARITARAAREAKDAALDSSLAQMKRNLLAREAEAALAAMQKKNAAREAALNPKRAQSAEDISRAQNEALIRSMHAQGLFQQQPTSDERARKAQRTSTADSTVHGGSSSFATGDEQKDGGDSAGDEKQRTLLVRWGKTASPAPSSDSLRALVDRSCAALSQVSAASGVPTVLEHVFLRAEKRKAMLVFARRSDAAAALPLLQAATSTATPLNPAMEVAWMQESSSSAAAARSSAAATPPPHAASMFAASAPSAAAAVPPASSSFSAASAAPAVPSFAFGTGASANLSAADYEQATMARMAAIAKQNKLKRQQAAEAAAAAAAASQPASTDSAPATSAVAPAAPST